MLYNRWLMLADDIFHLQVSWALIFSLFLWQHSVWFGWVWASGGFTPTHVETQSWTVVCGFHYHHLDLWKYNGYLRSQPPLLLLKALLNRDNPSHLSSASVFCFAEDSPLWPRPPASSLLICRLFIEAIKSFCWSEHQLSVWTRNHKTSISTNLN